MFETFYQVRVLIAMYGLDGVSVTTTSYSGSLIPALSTADHNEAVKPIRRLHPGWKLLRGESVSSESLYSMLEPLARWICTSCLVRVAGSAWDL